MEFFNREKEINYLVKVLSFEPNLIYFIYGPINSGKTTLIKHVIENELDRNKYIVFYINLREHFVSKYEDFIEVLFNTYEEPFIEKLKRYFLSFIKDLPDNIDIKSTILTGIPVPKNILNEFLSAKNSENVFKYLIRIFEDIKKKGKQPILIIDELQKIGDLKINGFLIYELFNFFIDLTKEKHLCHVLCLSSDSLFIERVYNEGMLKDRCKYYLVDDFDYETTRAFLKKHNFNDEEIEIIWHYFGGKPIKLVEAIQEKLLGEDIKEFCKKSLRVRKRQLKDLLYSLEDENKDLFERVIKLFENFKNKDEIFYEKITDEIVWTVKKNILFVNIEEGILKPQSRLDLLAIREILNEIKI